MLSADLIEISDRLDRLRIRSIGRMPRGDAEQFLAAIKDLISAAGDVERHEARIIPTPHQGAAS